MISPSPSTVKTILSFARRRTFPLSSVTSATTTIKSEPSATEIELESVPAELPFCYEEQTYEIQRTTPSTLNAPPVKGSSEGKVQLTEEERQRVLDEVERQQTEFGTEK